MKNLFILLTITAVAGFLLASCRQDEEMKKKLSDKVFAGIVNEGMAYHDFSMSINLDTSQHLVETYYLDINQDHINDLNVKVAHTTFDRIDIRPENTTSNIVSYTVKEYGCVKGACSNCPLKFCSGTLFRYVYNEPIKRDQGWTPTYLTIDIDNDSLYNDYYSLNNAYPSDTIQNLESNRFIGFRFIENKDTLYGWLRFSVIGKTHILIHDCAYQVKK